MGADGYIVDPTDGFRMEVICHACSLPLWDDDPPINVHHKCLAQDGRLPVRIEQENYEPR
jgi:hypothetical protein